MEQDDNMNRRVAIGWKKDMKEIKVCKHMEVKEVPKIRLGIFAPLLLGEGYKRRKVHYIGKTNAIENHRGYTSNKRTMERMGMKERAKDCYYAIIIYANLCCHSQCVMFINWQALVPLFFNPY
jgi:hypothetical protein